MTDTFTKKKRSEVMSRIRSGNTKPELIARSFLHRQGFRFSLQSKKLPGKPDIVLRKYKTVIFVHGCFWHQCPHCRGGRLPKSNLDYWKEKLEKNMKRDKENVKKLHEMGWKVITIWECEAKNDETLKQTLQTLLKQNAKPAPYSVL